MSKTTVNDIVKRHRNTSVSQPNS
ncbi:hypothetical protein [Chlorogloeopsis fritschii]|nr:hypothetical protein [Chlorogloeopsis fritschii]